MDYCCDICGGELREENGIIVCTECGYPLYEIEESFFAPYRDVYALIREKNFAEAKKRLKDLLQKFPQEPRLYWAAFLCRFGVVYEERGGYAFPYCMLLNRKSVYEDATLKKALNYSTDPLHTYFKAEALRIENARRVLAKEYAGDEIFLHDYDPLNDVVFERDFSTKRNRSRIGIGLGITTFVAATAGIIALIFTTFGNKPIEVEPVLSVNTANVGRYYSGQTIDSVKKDVMVYYLDAYGKNHRVTDFTIEGEIKVGQNEITITYESLVQKFFVVGIGVDGSEGLTYLTNGKEAVVTGYNGTSKEITIPYYYNGYSVTEIGDNAFLGSNITGISIPESVVAIGDSAFSGSALKELNIPSSVRQIGSSAFYMCSALTKADVQCPNLSSGMFANCPSLTEITLSNAIEEIPNSCFAQCTSLRNIVLPTSTKVIGPNAFGACTSLNSVYFPEALERIEKLAFAYIGEIAYPHYGGDWLLIEKEDKWSENTLFGPIIP